MAKGGMAEVFLARTLGIKGFERHVVLKFIRVEHGSDQKTIDMLLDEARLVASLHPRNIVQVHDVGRDEGKYFFAMEYVHGEDTRALLRKAKEKKVQIPFAHILTIITAAAAGLHYAHEQRGPDRKPLGIVHRDISPGNILVGFDGGVKVVDFGIAKTDRQADNTQAGEMKGKVGYMSPEQCKALPLDRRTDVYMLGIVLYELCCVRRLFKGENRFDTMAQIVAGNVPPPSRYRKDLPHELEQIIMKALATDPDDRYQTADDLRLVLEAFATRTNMQVSPSKLSDYMKELFGDVPEPWLVEEAPPDPHRAPTAVMVSDELLAEAAAAEARAVAEHELAARASKPALETASAAAQHAKANEAEPTPSIEPTLVVRVRDVESSDGDTPMAWPVDPGGVRRRRTVFGLIGVVVVAGSIGAYVMTRGDEPRAASSAATAVPDARGIVEVTADAAVSAVATPDEPAAPPDAAVEVVESTPDAGPEPVTAVIDRDRPKPVRPRPRPNRPKPNRPKPDTPKPDTPKPDAPKPDKPEDLDSPFPTD